MNVLPCDRCQGISKDAEKLIVRSWRRRRVIGRVWWPEYDPKMVGVLGTGHAGEILGADGGSPGSRESISLTFCYIFRLTCRHIFNLLSDERRGKQVVSALSTQPI